MGSIIGWSAAWFHSCHGALVSLNDFAELDRFVFAGGLTGCGIHFGVTDF